MSEMFFASDEPEEPQVPITGEFVFGYELEPLPEGWLADGVIVIVKCIGTDGLPYLSFRANEDLTLWEQLGMLRSAVLTVEQDNVDMWTFSADETEAD